jgi:hypothetical protein
MTYAGDIPRSRLGKGPRDTLSKITKSATSGVTREELGNLPLKILKLIFLALSFYN